jgi:lipopolysaccharide heptosyltransferase I
VNDPAARFLIVRLGSLGDVVHAIPAAAALKRRHPASVIDWVVDPRYVDLVKLVTVVNDVLPFDPRGAFSVLTAWRRLRAPRVHLRAPRYDGQVGAQDQIGRDVAYDAVIDLQGLLKSAVLARSVGARRTIGFSRRHLREPLARLFYTETVDPGDVPHVIQKGITVMRAVGVDDPAIVFPIAIPRSSATDAIAARVGTGGYALINPGAAWPNKRWPPERFGSLASAIRDRRGLRSVVLWGPGEERAASAVVAASRGAAEQAPPTTISDIVAVAKGASLMVSGDTGPLHLAAAVGTPIVALFGPTRAERNGPWSPSDVTISRYEACSCHYERRCRRNEPCINDISLDEVVAAVERRVAAR